MRRPSRLKSRSPSFCSELVVHQIDEVGRLAGVHAGRDQMQRLGLGALGLILGDCAGLDHRIEHQVAPLDGAVRMTEGIEVVGALNDAGQQCALGQVELAHILAEVGLRRFTEAVDGKAAALAEWNSLAYISKICFFVEAVLKLEGDDDLDDFASNRPSRG